jgi:heptaprenyl diphosphate synthase
MRIGFSHKYLHTLAECAALLVIAMALSYLEAVLPLQAVIPLPGVKLGLANLAILVAAHRHGAAAAAAVSVTRVILSSLLFGSVSSMAFSLSGALFSLLVLTSLLPLRGRWLSYIGLSVACAAAHSAGQILCAVLWMHESSLFGYLPILLLISLFTGTLTGTGANLLAERLPLSLSEKGDNG